MLFTDKVFFKYCTILFTSISDPGEKGEWCDLGFWGRKSYYLMVIILSHSFIIIILYRGLLDLCLKTKRISRKRSEGTRGGEGGGRGAPLVGCTLHGADSRRVMLSSSCLGPFGHRCPWTGGSLGAPKHPLYPPRAPPASPPKPLCLHSRGSQEPGLCTSTAPGSLTIALSVPRTERPVTVGQLVEDFFFRMECKVLLPWGCLFLLQCLSLQVSSSCRVPFSPYPSPPSSVSFLFQAHISGH